MQTILPVDQLVGAILGKYQIERLLNHGKLGTAYLARKYRQEQPVMITLFPLPEKFSDRARQAFGKRFIQEGQRLMQLQHPRLLPLYTYGQHTSYPYLVSAFVKGRSLAQILKQQPRFTLPQVARVLKQIALVLDYIHQNGAMHGLLNPTSILIDDNQAIQLAGVGLRGILEMYGIEYSNHPYAHLYSIAETFLGAPAYLAPECVGSEPLDARADLYALAIILFEMITGARPFTGKDHLEIVLQRLQVPVPSLQAVSADVPVEFDLFMQKALHRNPAQRFQSASEMALAFESILQAVATNGQRNIGARQSALENVETTLPPTVNWFDGAMEMELPGQGVPPVTMGYLSSIESTSSARIPAQRPQVSLQNHPTESKPEPARPAAVFGAEDPFARWSATSAKMEAPQAEALTQSKKADAVSAPAQGQKKQPPAKSSRRKVVALLAVGGVAVAGLGLAGASFAHMLPFGQSPAPVGSSTNQKKQTGNTSSTTKKTTTGSQRNTSQSSTKKTQQDTGTVVGKTSLASNTVIAFTNPADGKESLLIHLPDGTFVAGERACTHQGIPVNYDAASQKLVCPLHGATFDPANNFSVTKGPAETPLKAVAIHVNTDGTITV